MTVTHKDFAKIAFRAAKEARIFFFCGPDEAGVQDAAARIVELLADPGERIDLNGGDLRRDPVRLGDEARSDSLFERNRHIVVRTAGDEAYDAVKILIEGTAEACPVLIVATGATDKSRTAKLLADRSDSLVAMFWPPDLKAVAGAIRTMGDAAGLRIGSDLAERLARAAGMDTRIARSEIAKLALYADASPEQPQDATAAMVDAVGASIEEDGFMPLINAVLSGDVAKLQPELRRLHELGLNPVAVLLACERRTAQLAQLAARLGPHGNIRALLEGEKQARRIVWKDQNDLEAQLKRWRGRRLGRLVERIAALHRSLLTNNQSAELLLAQGLAEIARAAIVKN